MNRETISNELCDLLELPRLGRRGKAWDIVNAVLRVLTNGLLRGETIRVDGFGILRIRRRAPIKHHYYFFPYLGKGQYSEVSIMPAKAYIHFTPAKPLLKMINEDPDGS